jgi:hypothetical protein
VPPTKNQEQILQFFPGSRHGIISLSEASHTSRKEAANNLKLPKIEMRDDQHRFLMLLGQLPARLTAEQAAWVLNCQPHDIPVLVSSRLLKPLGNPPPNGIKFFATADLLEFVKDRNWLIRVTSTINQHWHKKNARKNGCLSSRPDNGHGALVELA